MASETTILGAHPSRAARANATTENARSRGNSRGAADELGESEDDPPAGEIAQSDEGERDDGDESHDHDAATVLAGAEAGDHGDDGDGHEADSPEQDESE